MKTEQPSRRGFFKAVAIGGATAAAAVATTLVGERKSVTNAATAADSTQTGYRETAHIRHYYRTTQV
jgi:2-methylcitrate dehydratase PrpD